MSQKRVKMFQMESLRLSINEHMESVREEISCVVNERLSSVEHFLCSLFQREIETLETLLDRRDKQLDMILQPHVKLHRADSLHLPVYKEEVSPEQQERSPSLAQEEPEPPHIKEEQEELLQRPEEADVSTMTSLAVKIEGDDENRDTESLASTSTEHRKTQDDDITEDSGEWEEETRVLNQTLKSHMTQNVKGDRNKLSQDMTSSKQTHSTRMHTRKERFLCTVCGKGFSLKSTLKLHMMTHTGQKPFTCTICGKGCVHRGELKSHMMTHTGEKPYTCTICGKGFTQKCNLKTHMANHMTHKVETHTVEKPFTCAVCGKGCRRRDHLKKHMMTHTGEKPFACTFCGKAFIARDQLKIHLMIHTGERPFTCAVCGKGYVQRRELKTHMMTH